MPKVGTTGQILFTTIIKQSFGEYLYKATKATHHIKTTK